MQYTYENPHKIYMHRMQAGLFPCDCAELCGVSLRTWRKWEETGHIPKVALELVKARAGTIWDGWFYRDGILTDYAGRTYKEGDLMAAYYALKAVDQDIAQFITQSRRNIKGKENWSTSSKKLDRAEPIKVIDFEKRQGLFGF